MQVAAVQTTPVAADIESNATEHAVLMATVVIGPTGDTLGHYGKRHLHNAEAEFFVPGGHHLLLEIDDWRLGFAICYDAAVPEHATATLVRP